VSRTATKPIATDRLPQGQAVSASAASPYEQRFAARVGAGHAISFGFGRTAIAVALGPDGIGQAGGGDVVCSALTCRVVPLAIISAGRAPAFAEIDARSLNLDPISLAGRWPDATRAVLFQHTYGQSAGLEQVADLARSRRVPLLEDRAQTFPAPGLPLRGVAAIYSNNLLKPLPAGSGAMLVTDDDGFAARMRAARDRLPVLGWAGDARLALEQAIQDRWLTSRRYWALYDWHRRWERRRPDGREAMLEREIRASAVRISPRQEARGLAWLERAARIADVRSWAVERYRKEFGGDLRGPLYYFPLRAANKPGLIAEARRRRIEIVAWPIRFPIYPVEAAAELPTLGYDPGRCPIAERVAETLVGLPTTAGDDLAELERVIELVKSAGGGSGEVP